MTMNDERMSCGVVLARVTGTGWMTLMLRAYNHWDFPKGIQEVGEAPLETALRELGEEAGIESVVFEWGDHRIVTGPYRSGKTACYFIAKTTQQDVVMGISPATGVPEHNEWRWVSFDTAYDLSTPRVRQVVQWARQIIGA